MPSICLYFQVHQPNRLKEFSFFDLGHNISYENEALNLEILNKVCEKCYIPANSLLLELIEKHQGKFKVSFSITGILIEQLEKWRPDVITSFQQLAKTGCVEFLSETYFHSLSSVYDIEEFEHQVNKHKNKIIELFGQTPIAFRNTELIFNNDLCLWLEKHNFKTVLCEGTDRALQMRKPDQVFKSAVADLLILTRNYKLTDDIAFRFSNQYWSEWPVTAHKYSKWLELIEKEVQVISLFMDYETLGEHQWADSGIFDFFREFPEKILQNTIYTFNTVSEVSAMYTPMEKLDIPVHNSWADTERDLSAWAQNSMQVEALEKIYKLKKLVLNTNNSDLLHTWRKLQTSDHFYYMSTKHLNDGAVHSYFSPYKSPYDAYLFYMNILADFEVILNKYQKN